MELSHFLLKRFGVCLVLFLLCSMAVFASDPNLVAHWKLDGDFLDSSPYLHHGTFYDADASGVQWVSGADGQAIDIDGVDDYVEIDNSHSMLAGSNAVTVSLWIKTYTTNPEGLTGGHLVTKGEAGSPSAFTCAVHNNAANRLRIRYKLSDTDYQTGVYTDVNYWDDEWHHLAYVIASGDQRIYFDGVEVGSSTNTGDFNLSDDTDPVRIGAAYFDPSGTYTAYFDGTIDDVRIYDRALSEAEIADMVGPILSVSETDFAFVALEAGANPNDQILTVSNSGGETVNWSIVDANEVTFSPPGWLTIVPTSGSLGYDESEPVTLSVDITGLSDGQYSYVFDIVDSNAISSPQSVTVDLYVPEDGVLGVPGMYSTIQAAINAAANGDTIVIAPGTYTGTGNRDLDTLGKYITIRSVDPDNPAIVETTVIDCQGTEAEPHRGFIIHSGESLETTINGLTITNGVGDGGGGGILVDNSAVTIENCQIINNVAKDGDGGGIYSLSSELFIHDSVIQNNKAADALSYLSDAGQGGGIYCTSAVITNSNIIGNSSGNGGANYDGGGSGGDGGGIYCQLQLDMTYCTVAENETGYAPTASWQRGNGGNGAGIYGGPDSTLIIDKCTIENNTTGDGAGCGTHNTTNGNGHGGSGAGIYGAEVVITNSALGSNTTGDGGWDGSPVSGFGGNGAGIYCEELSAINCIIINNTTGNGGVAYWGSIGGDGGDGAGIYCQESLIAQNCLIADNSSGTGGYGYITGGNGGDGSGIYVMNTSTSSVSNCTIINNLNGIGGNSEDTAGCDGLGAGLYGNADTQALDTIFWANSPDQLYGQNCTNVTYCNIEGNPCSGSTGNIASDPDFVTGPNGDYYLSQIAAGQAATSPCIDAGSDTAVNLGLWKYTTRTDEAGDISIVDMGYHYPMTYPIGDINTDTKVNLSDFAILASQWLTVPGSPSADIAPYPDGDNTVDMDDLLLLIDNWFEGT